MVRGEVVEVDTRGGYHNGTPAGGGEELTIPTGSNQTFNVDENTVIRDNVYATQLEEDLDNIEETTLSDWLSNRTTTGG